jgi:hypothetical protein
MCTLSSRTHTLKPAHLYALSHAHIRTATPSTASGLSQSYLCVLTASHFHLLRYARAAQVYRVQGGALVNVTSTIGITTLTAAVGSTPGVYRIGNTTFNGNTGDATVDVTFAPTAPSSSSTGLIPGTGKE